MSTAALLASQAAGTQPIAGGKRPFYQRRRATALAPVAPAQADENGVEQVVYAEGCTFSLERGVGLAVDESDQRSHVGEVGLV